MAVLSFLKSVAQISWDFLGAVIFAFVAWYFWQIGVGEWVLFRLFAMTFAGGAVLCVLKGLWKLAKLLLHDLAVAFFNPKAAKPKADPRADEAALRKKGLIK